MRILILNGPNLNLLGQREPEVYGTQTLGDLENQFRKNFQGQGVDFEWYQTNHEGHLIDALHRARNRNIQGIVFNPGGYCHTSVALRDAIAAIKIPVVEVHISNIYAREEFRHHSLTAGVCLGQIGGLGLQGYELAVQALMRLLRTPLPVAEPARPAERAPESKEVRERETRERETRERETRERETRERETRERETRERETREREGRPEERHEEARREEQDRDGKRRRRGRRGGRGRRRGEQEEGGAPREEREGAEAAEHETIDIAERYANLKGVVVRRGLDVLAEFDEEGEEEKAPVSPKGMVTFRDEDEDTVAHAAPPEEEPVLNVIPAAHAPSRRAASAHPAPKEAPAPASAEKAAPRHVEEVAAPTPTPAAVEPAAAPVTEEAPVAARAVAAQHLEPAAAEAESAGEGAGEGEAEAPKSTRARGGRRKTATGDRRRAPRKKAEE